MRKLVTILVTFCSHRININASAEGPDTINCIACSPINFNCAPIKIRVRFLPTVITDLTVICGTHSADIVGSKRGQKWKHTFSSAINRQTEVFSRDTDVSRPCYKRPLTNRDKSYLGGLDKTR